MENIVCTLTSATTVVYVSDVALNKLESRPLIRSNQTFNFIKVMLIASAEVVQANNSLIQFEQGFKQVAADKTRNASNEPGFRLSLELLLQ
jgi:hypothetical protein